MKIFTITFYPGEFGSVVSCFAFKSEELARAHALKVLRDLQCDPELHEFQYQINDLVYIEGEENV